MRAIDLVVLFAYCSTFGCGSSISRFTAEDDKHQVVVELERDAGLHLLDRRTLRIKAGPKEKQALATVFEQRGWGNDLVYAEWIGEAHFVVCICTDYNPKLVVAVFRYREDAATELEDGSTVEADLLADVFKRTRDRFTSAEKGPAERGCARRARAATAAKDSVHWMLPK